MPVRNSSVLTTRIPARGHLHSDNKAAGVRGQQGASGDERARPDGGGERGGRGCTPALTVAAGRPPTWARAFKCFVSSASRHPTVDGACVWHGLAHQAVPAA
ncbi:hypothetical protein EON67_11855 [archaeon]|nr:MAG: hypothetical protein EON67_11855 [archaeon]